MSFFDQPWPYLATFILVASIGLYAWRQPRLPGTQYFGWIIGLWLVWSLAATVTTLVQAIVPLHYALWVIKNACAWMTSPLAVMFALEYTGSERWLKLRTLAVLSIPAFLFTLAATLLPSSTLVSIMVGSGFVVIVPHDFLNVTSYTVNIVIWLINAYILIKCLLQAPAFSAPIVLILLGQAFPRAGYFFVDLMPEYVSPAQALIILSNFTALTYFIAIYYFKILQITPVARDVVVNTMPYATIVLDTTNRVVDYNPAARTLPSLIGKIKVGQPASRVFNDWWNQLSCMIGIPSSSNEITIHADLGHLHYKIQSIPLLQPNGWRIGQIFIIEDITRLWQIQQQQAQMMWAQAAFQEREQLANELHDGLSQDLAFLNLQAQTAQLYLERGQNEAAKESLTRLTSVADVIQENTREFISILLHEKLPVENFFGAMQQIVKNFETRASLSVNLEIQTDGYQTGNGKDCLGPTQLAPSVAVQLVRITQEALANVQKHAKGASEVKVLLKASDEEVLLTVEDDGEGFDPSAVEGNGQHFGLQVMRSRAERIGGQVFFDSRLGKGTRVQVCAPLSGVKIKES
jgi:signal transduction histidine kinase